MAMNDAVKPAVSDEMVEAAKAELFKRGLVDVFSVRAAISAALAAQGQEPVAWPNGCDKTAVRALRFLAQHDRPIGGEQTFNAAHLHQIADELQQMASKPLYRSATLAAQGQELVGGDIISAARDICRVMDIDVSGRDISWRQSLESAVQSLRSALTAPAQPVGNDIADAVLSWMAKHDLLDAGNEYHASDVLAVLDELAPAQPVGVPEGWRLVPVEPTDEMINAPEVDAGERTTRKAWRGMLAAAPQPPAEGGWKPIESAPKAPWDVPILVCRLGKANPWYGDQHISGYADVPGSAYWNDAGDCWTWIDAPHDACVPTHWMPLPPAPANGGEQ